MTQVAELPRETIQAGQTAVTGQSFYVAAGGDLQAAINAAQPGDEIVLQRGATFIGSFTLPNKVGDGWINIRTEGSQPDAGTRVTETDASWMAKILSPGFNQAALSTQPGAHNYHISGVEISTVPGVTSLDTLVNLGDGTSAQNTLALQPHDLVLDHVYIHGSSTLDLRHAVALNGSR